MTLDVGHENLKFLPLSRTFVFGLTCNMAATGPCSIMAYPPLPIPVPYKSSECPWPRFAAVDRVRELVTVEVRPMDTSWRRLAIAFVARSSRPTIGLEKTNSTLAKSEGDLICSANNQHGPAIRLFVERSSSTHFNASTTSICYIHWVQRCR